MPDDMIDVEVAYALPDQQTVLQMKVKRGTNLYDVVQQSGIGDRIGGFDLTAATLGVFGKIERNPHARVLEEGERAEIYRPLVADPKEVRKKRAAAKIEGAE